MDGTTVATTSNAFLEWFQTSGQVIYIILQMVYWIVLGFAAVFAAFQAKRLVDYKIGKAAAKSGAVAVRDETAEDAPIDEFVD